MSRAVELVLAQLINERGGQITFSELLEITNIPRRSLKKFLWYCQRHRLIRKDIGIYYLTEMGKDALYRNKIIRFDRNVYIVKLSDDGKVYLITLGKKMRIRLINKDILKSLLEKECISKAEIKNSKNKRDIMAVIRLFRLLNAVRYKGEWICIEPSEKVRLSELGIIV